MKRKKLVVLLMTCLCIELSCHPVRHLAKSLALVKSRLAQARHFVPAHHAIKRGCRRDKQVVDTDEFDPAIGEIRYLKTASQLLRHIPGACKVGGPLQTVLNYGKKGQKKNHGTARGAMYELEQAVRLAQEGYRIAACAIHLCNREFDLLVITPLGDAQLIECKNIVWSTVQCDKTQKQLDAQQKIARRLGIPLALHSRNPVPLALREWLDQENITVAND